MEELRCTLSVQRSALSTYKYIPLLMLQSHSTGNFQCMGHINFLDKVGFFCVWWVDLQEQNTIFVRREKGIYFYGKLLQNWLRSCMLVLHLSARVWRVFSSSLGVLTQAPQTTSCIMNGRRWHRSPAVGQRRHHLPMAVSGRHPGEVFLFSTLPPQKGLQCFLRICKQCKFSHMPNGVEFAQSNG